jgi:hypothetical protein
MQVIVLSPHTSRLTELTPSLLITCHLQLKSLLTPHDSRITDLWLCELRVLWCEIFGLV